MNYIQLLFNKYFKAFLAWLKINPATPSNVEFWNTKLDSNVARDAQNVEALKECELKDIEKLTERLLR